MRNRLGHDGGVDDDALHAGSLHDATTPGGLDGGHEQSLHTFFADALPPAREAARVDGRFGLQVHLAAQVLPIRVLHPGVDDDFVGGIEGVLQVEQAGDQTGWQRGPASARGEGHGEGEFDLAPVDQLCQAHQRVLQVDQFIQAVDEQGIGAGRRRLGSHRNTSSKFARKLHCSTLHLAIRAPGKRGNHQRIQRVEDCSGRTHYLSQVTQAQLETPVPANAQNDDLAFEMQALEKGVHALSRLRHRSAFSSKATAYRRRNLHQN